MIVVDVFVKDPDEVLDFVGDWSEWLGGDTITDVDWTVPEDLTDDSDTFDDTSVTLWLSGGVAGGVYDIGCCVTTVGGRVGCRTFRVLCSER